MFLARDLRRRDVPPAPPESAATAPSWIFRGAAVLACTCLYLAGIGAESFVDPDLWHQMALFRAWLSEGRLPTVDPFSFTSSVVPLVHHEWGLGAVAYAAGHWLGAVGLGVLRDLLIVATLAPWVLCAKQREVSAPVLWATLPLAIVLVWISVATVRAQMFTVLFLSWLLWFLTLDRSGRRWWIAPWLLIHLLWVNLHAGFVVGAIAFAIHVAERAFARQPVRHLLLTGAAMVVLTSVNPYGLDYFPYLRHALRMDRPLINEWLPLLEAEWQLVAAYVFSLVLLGYALLRARPRSLAGLLFLTAAAYAAVRHQRHLSLYGVAWACTVPPLLAATPLGQLLKRTLHPAKRTAAVAAVVAAAGAFVLFAQQSRRPIVPANPGEHATLLYPVGAVDYLRETGAQLNLLTPFEVGAFVSWKLFPQVKVSLDGRFEVAYAPDLLERHLRFYGGSEGTGDLLRELAPDAVLMPLNAPALPRVQALPEWRSVYRDDAFELFVSSALSLELPTVDRRGSELVGHFP